MLGGMNRKPYSSDLTDAQWTELAPLLPPSKPRGHPRTVDLREIVYGILYVLRGGIPWRMVPHASGSVGITEGERDTLAHGAP